MHRAEPDALLDEALTAARDTRVVVVDRGARRRAAAVFEALFGSASAIVVADANTFEAAGRNVWDSLAAAGRSCGEPVILPPEVYAEYGFVVALHAELSKRDAIPVAVGSGTINDLTKLVAHRLGRPYMVVATAASMDGYTAYGASITYNGSKQTFDCPAPAGVVADLDVIASAPPGMNASGYADLMAKCAAGADWIVADSAGTEGIDAAAWRAVQGPLRSWLGSPAEIRRNDPAALRHLIQGLMISGFAMQALESSRPASGAEHQFSHLWDMQHHTHRGAAPSHGFKVGIGTLASLALYEGLLRLDAASFDVDAAVRQWPSWEAVQARIAECLAEPELQAKALEEMSAKYIPHHALRRQLTGLAGAWPALRERLRRHLLPFPTARNMLREAGCAFEPEQIGITRERLRASYEQAYFIRRRFTVLDFAERWSLTEAALDRIFGPNGAWPTAPAPTTAGACK